MQDLISNPEPTMSTLDLYEIVIEARGKAKESHIRRNDFHDRVFNELYGEDYEVFVVKNPNGTETHAARLTQDQCILVAMRESKAVRRYVLDRLKELEAQQAPRVPTTMAEALRLAADQAEELERQQAQLEAQKPAVEFVERYTDSTGLVSLTQAAKDLQFKPRAFTKALEESGYLYRSGGALTPYQKYLDQGLFAMVSGEKGGHGYSQTKVTTKGKTVFAQRFASELID